MRVLPVVCLIVLSGLSPKSLAVEGYSERSSLDTARIQRHIIDSKYFGEPREFYVYTPPEYDKYPERRYPVLYLLHGGGQNARSWFEFGRAHQIIDSLLSEGKACPMLLVSPTVYGRVVPKKGGPRQDMEQALIEFPQHFMDEVMPCVSKRYRLLATRENQAVAGLSNGAAHARTIALQHLDQFGWIGSWSGGGGRPKSVRKDAAYLQAHPHMVHDYQPYLFMIAKGEREAWSNQPFVDFIRTVGIRPVCRTASFGHDWQTWQQLLTWFVQHIFVEQQRSQIGHCNDVIPGAIASPYPTLICLGLEWLVQGDDNLNSLVTVRYRVADSTIWKEGMPLRRVPAGKWELESDRPTSHPGFAWRNKHSGSLFDLQPGTEYEIQLHLEDPDGGSEERTLPARTRCVPEAMAGAPIKRATPANLRSLAALAQPGDILLLGPGNYGYFEVPCNGEPERPIVFRADPKGVFPDSTRSGTRPPRRGKPLFEGVSLQKRKHVYLEGLVSYGTIDLFNAQSCAVKRCQVNAVFGIISSYSENLRKWAPKVASRLTNPKARPQPHALNCYIADNIVIGLTTWVPEALGASGANMGEGIEVTGPGNVICYNRVVGFRDCISTLEGSHAVNQVCIDIYNNDVDVGPDDGIEADFCMGNCRIMRNRIANCGMGVSSQPGLGGPTYFIRNVMYNLTNAPYKFYRGSIGDVVLHNTVVKAGDGAACPASQPWSRAYFRNNLGIGGGSVRRFGRDDEGPVLAAYFPGADSTCDFDYNGYGTADGTLRGNIGGRLFDNLEELRAGPEPHGVQISLDTFVGAVHLPDPPFPARVPPDLCLAAGSTAVDAAVAIPNINDEYVGIAPDLGAYELDQELPIYGPRPH